MFTPGRDSNYPSSSGNATSGIFAQQFSINGFHITFGVITLILLALIILNGARRRR